MIVGLFCASLSVRSANAETLRVASSRLQASGHAVTMIAGLEAIPPFDPALVDEACALANQYEIDLEAAFRSKKQRNKTRTWQ